MKSVNKLRFSFYGNFFFNKKAIILFCSLKFEAQSLYRCAWLPSDAPTPFVVSLCHIQPTKLLLINKSRGPKLKFSKISNKPFLHLSYHSLVIFHTFLPFSYQSTFFWEIFLLKFINNLSFGPPNHNFQILQ